MLYSQNKHNSALPLRHLQDYILKKVNGRQRTLRVGRLGLEGNTWGVPTWSQVFKLIKYTYDPYWYTFRNRDIGAFAEAVATELQWHSVLYRNYDELADWYDQCHFINALEVNGFGYIAKVAAL